MARALALGAALAVSLLAVSGARDADAQTPKRGGSVVVATPAFLEPACLNPFVDTCSSRYLDRVLLGAYEVMPDATYRPVLARAEVVTRLPFTLLYRIRPEARWSDGTPVTAGDFQYTHDAIVKLRPEFEDIHLALVRSVRALDAKTFRVRLRAPYADWRELFTWVLPRHALVGLDFAKVWQSAVDNPKTGAAIGSGPFLVERLERGRRLVLRRNARYWGPHPAYLDRLVHRFIAPGDAAEALRRSEVDMIDPGPFVLQAAALELRRQRAPGISVLTFPGGSAWEHFDIRIGSGGHPALKSRLVRQALAYGIDREEMARVAGELAGASDARPEPLDSVVFLSNSRYYRPSWRAYRYRPAQAQRLLERAGCRRGADNIYICTGERLSLRIVTAAGVERRKRTLELAQAQLRRVGVEVVPVFAPPLTLTGNILQAGDFDLAQFAWIGGAQTSGPYDIFGCQQPRNFTDYCDRLLTRDLDQAARIIDDQRRVRLLHKIDARLATAVPAIPLFQIPGLFALKANVRGVVPNVVGGQFTWNAEEWWLER